jgi:transposase
MKGPIFVRPLSDAERETLEAGLRSPDAFTLRRCQILLASNRGENAYQIAHQLGCNPQTARNAILTFNDKGLPESLQPGSKHPHTVHRAFAAEQAEALQEMLHRSPRKFGHDSSLWS